MPARPPRPPGPPSVPLLGSLPWLARDPLAFYRRMALEFGPVSYARVGPVDLYMLGDPALVDELLNDKPKSCMKDTATQSLIPLVGGGLLTSEGETWKRQRKLCAPPLAPKRLAAYEEGMVQSATRAFAAYRDGEQRDFHADSMALTLEIVAKALLGIEGGAELSRVSHSLDTAMDYYAERLHNVGMLLPASFPTPRYLRFRRAKRELDAVVRKLIADARDDGADHLLARLLHARGEDGQGMSEQALLDEAITMLLAGHETTALVLTYTVYLLARHPAQAAALAREIDDVLGDRAATPAELANLPYLDAVIRESLRIYPPVYAFGREVVEPFELGGYTMPVGAQVLTAPFGVHRNPLYWREPDEFRPERWLNGETRDLPRYAYMPFGGGHRICIGSHFALLELALVIATMVQQVELTPVPGFQLSLDPVITLRSRHGMPVRVKRRQSRAAETPRVQGGHGCPYGSH
jgi:cytochrome P450